MTIEEAIIDWAATRPFWQRMILRKVARGEEISPDDVSMLVDRIVGDKPNPDEAFSVDDLPARAATGLTTVRMLELRNARNVNALLQDQSLTFAPFGLTIVYGDNGSGKSGYARLIKQIVRARHTEPILTDIFSDCGVTDPSAEVVIQNGELREEFTWPDQNLPDVARIGFFDEACGDLYLTSESEVTYRPAALFVLDGLIRTCDRAREELDRRIAANTAAACELPILPKGTQARGFLETLSAETTEDQVNVACAWRVESDGETSRLASEEARLRATDPTREKARLQKIATQLIALSAHIAECERVIGNTAVASLSDLHKELRRRKVAAELASNRSFDSEPLRGVGSEAWRTLWEAARRFAEQSCNSTPFPYTGVDARCPLCQQLLGDEASERLKGFEAFIRDVTQQELERATQALLRAQQEVENFQPLSPTILRVLEDLMESHSRVAQDYRRVFESYQSRRTGLLGALRLEEWLSPSLEPTGVVETDAKELAAEVRREAEQIDDQSFASILSSTAKARVELEATHTLSSIRPAVLAELKRLKQKKRLEQAKEATNTQGISRKAADLTREYVTALIRDSFTRESDRLKLERVTLNDVGGKKGALQHQPAFVGATQRVSMSSVLSEGEQTAIGLAGFFTDVRLEPTKSAIVLDDPVSSLDHVRRGYVAARLAELAKDRQVIVFTHDIAFIADLRLAAESEGVDVCERAIERRQTGQPGTCLTSHPWKAKDISQRLQSLDQELARIRREMGDWNQERYERETADWGGRLSETWERLINMEVIGKILDRGSQEVRPRMFRMLARITQEDDREFQSSYTKCSRWARRHDKSIALNYVAPTIDELSSELALVRKWYDRVRKYSQSMPRISDDRKVIRATYGP